MQIDFLKKLVSVGLIDVCSIVQYRIMVNPFRIDISISTTLVPLLISSTVISEAVGVISLTL